MSAIVGVNVSSKGITHDIIGLTEKEYNTILIGLGRLNALAIEESSKLHGFDDIIDDEDFNSYDLYQKILNNSKSRLKILI